MSEQSGRGNQSRRAFLLNLAGLGAGAAMLPGCARAAGGAMGAAGGAIRPSADNIGVQLYTVRDLLQQDFEGTLQRVAQLGYKQVEFAGYYNRTPQQVRAVLDRLGLSSPSAHINAQQLRQDLPNQIQTARTIGQSYITAPSWQFQRDSADSWKQAAAEFNRIGQQVRDAGLRFAYHNHNWELTSQPGGRSGLEILLTETDPALVDFELDLYWATHAGRDPVQLFQQYPGRFTMWHVKDMRNPQTTKDMAPVGQGTIDYRRIFANAQLSGLRYFFVEHDNAAQTGGSLQSIQTSVQALRQLLA